jgi:hypothetical protein
MQKRISPGWVIPALAISTLGGTLAFQGPGALGAPPASEVTVVNRPSNAVPVRLVGAGLGAVAVRDVDHPARRPFQAKVRIELPAGQCCENGFVDVPAGQRLVIEYASALGLAPAGQTFNFEVGTLLNGHPSFDQNHLLPVLQQQHEGGSSTATAGQVVRIYSDGGPARVMLRASRSGSGAAVAFMTVSGHLADAP